ncbi:hypothetical protein LguiB_000443 [Lonicera macranthoides]
MISASKLEYVEFEERTSPNEIVDQLGCTLWSGSGPGLMDAATQGALQAGKPVGGFTIAKEAGEWTASNFHPYLPAESYLTCSIKHGLVDAVVCSSSSEDSCSCSPWWDWHPRQVFRDSIVDSTRKG